LSTICLPGPCLLPASPVTTAPVFTGSLAAWAVAPPDACGFLPAAGACLLDSAAVCADALSGLVISRARTTPTVLFETTWCDMGLFLRGHMVPET
jgi:hypothetical protein